MMRVAFYTRISTDETLQKYSLDAQRDRLEAAARVQYGDDWTLFKMYRDQESGTHMRRPGLAEMLADAQARSFDVLLVYRVDRLSRKLRQLAQMVDDLTEWGVALKSITEPFDSGNLAGMMMLQMLGVFAQFEHGTIVERTKVGMEKKARSGFWVGGAVPYGYRIDADKKTILPFPDEALIVRRIFTSYAVGNVGVRAIRDSLTADGHRKRSGKPWDPRILLHVLRNDVYVGKIRWKGKLHQGSHEPIVSQEVFDRAGEILQTRGEELKGRQWHTHSERLITGIIRCALCGRHMVGVSGNKKGRKTPYYACNGRLSKSGCTMEYIRADQLEAQIISDFKDLFRSDEMVERVWKEASRLLESERPELEAEAAKINGDLAKAQDQLDRYYRAFENGTMNPEACGTRLEEINVHVAALGARRATVAERLTQLAMPALDLKEVADLMDDFERVFESGLNAQKKHLLHRLVKEVRVQDRNTAEVWYQFPRPAAANERTAHSHIWLRALVSVRTAKTRAIRAWRLERESPDHDPRVHEPSAHIVNLRVSRLSIGR
jgi:site-specific DNA recombinase